MRQSGSALSSVEDRTPISQEPSVPTSTVAEMVCIPTSHECSASHTPLPVLVLTGWGEPESQLKRLLFEPRASWVMGKHSAPHSSLHFADNLQTVSILTALTLTGCAFQELLYPLSCFELLFSFFFFL